MPPSYVLHPTTRLARLLHNHRSERSIVLATPLAHDLDPLHRSSHCGCHTGSLILGIHASQQNDQKLATQGGHGRTLTADQLAGEVWAVAVLLKKKRNAATMLFIAGGRLDCWIWAGVPGKRQSPRQFGRSRCGSWR